MSLKIEVDVPFDMIQNDRASAYLKCALSAIGYAPVGAERVIGSSPDLAAPYAGEIATNNPEPAPEPVKTEEAPKRRGRKAAEPEADAKPNISTSPENRVDPAQVEADAKQDAEDEAAEVEAKRDVKAPLTIDDVKAAMTAYVTKYGLPATQEDGPRIFVEALGNPPAGESYWKLSLLPNDQDALQKAVDTWAKAVELNPMKRDPVAKGA